MLWTGVPISAHPAELIVAAAALRLLEYHDVALTAVRDGEAFDPMVEGVDTIFGSYALRRNLGDARRPYWLCAATYVSECDVQEARASLGAFARDIKVIDVDTAPCIHKACQFTPCLIEAFAKEMGIALPVDAHARLRRLVNKHMPRTTATRHGPADVPGCAEQLARVLSVGQTVYNLHGQGELIETDSSDDSDEEDETRAARRAVKRRRREWIIMS